VPVNELQTDLLILGAGMAGLTAGAYAASHGADVMIAERGPEIGGNAAHAMGKVWTARSLQSLRAEDPGGNDKLHRALFETYPELLAWIGGTGVWMSDSIDVLHGQGFLIDILGYLKKCRMIIESNGGWVVPGTSTTRLEVENGRVVGAWLHSDDDPGEQLIRAAVTLLATGGFQANLALRRELMGPHSDGLLLRASPHSRGDGLRLGLSVGGELSGKTTAYYGHLISEPAVSFGPGEFLRLSMKFSPHCLMLNLDGRRFADESKGDHYNAQAAGEQREGRALLVFDDRVYSANKEVIAEAVEAGAHAVSADRPSDLASRAAEWGYDPAETVRTVAGYNEAVARGGPDDVPRHSLRSPLEMAGPLHAIEVRSGITFTNAGLKADIDGQVCRGDEFVPGLLVAGADLGGVYAGGYAGGLALAGVFGYRAARRTLTLLQRAKDAAAVPGAPGTAHRPG
jgi:succinate dehydrogenase/fumarate reductase flavoprotein subunit